MLIRDARLEDLPAVLDIHNAAIADSTAIWETELVDLRNRRQWFDERRTDGFPVIVATDDGRVAGYATYGPWRPKSGYRYTVENSVYVAHDFHRRGVATLLMTELMNRARHAELHAVVAGIESANYVSIALHAKFGFHVVGELPQVGWKFGRWLDLTLMQITLDGRA